VESVLVVEWNADVVFISIGRYQPWLLLNVVHPIHLHDHTSQLRVFSPLGHFVTIHLNVRGNSYTENGAYRML